MRKYQLATKRLILRHPAKQDVAIVAQHLSNPLIAETTLHIPYPYSKSDARTWINKSRESLLNNTAVSFAIILRTTQMIIGAIGLHPNAEHNRAEAGYWIAVPYWNRGVATEALKAIIDFGFHELKFEKIYATHLIGNDASGRVMSKAGMVKEGRLKNHYKKDDRYVSVIQYRITRDEFEKQNKKKTAAR